MCFHQLFTSYHAYEYYEYIHIYAYLLLLKMVSQPDTMPLFANNYWMQMTETGVRWVVLGLPQDGACTDLFENFSEISLKEDLSNATTFNPPFFSLVDTLKVAYIFLKIADRGLCMPVWTPHPPNLPDN